MNTRKSEYCRGFCNKTQKKILIFYRNFVTVSVTKQNSPSRRCRQTFPSNIPKAGIISSAGEGPVLLEDPIEGTI